MATVLPTTTTDERRDAVRQAAERLRAGEVVALPTETVYGLAANALDDRAVRRIYEIKDRPSHNPLIVHVASLDMARECVRGWPETAARLAHGFWPGPLTLVLPKAPGIPDIVTAGGATVAVRWSAHEVMQDVIRACGFPLAAPSANPSNAVSPTTAAHVARTLGARLGLILDGGPSAVGIESTVVDLTTDPPRVLRPGVVHEPAIAAALLAPLAEGPVAGPPVPRSPGQLHRHYSPSTRLVVADWHDEASFHAVLGRLPEPARRAFVLTHGSPPAHHGLAGVAVMPHDAAAYARALYAELHRADDLGADAIVVHAVPEGHEWTAVRDRLRRATGEDDPEDAG